MVHNAALNSSDNLLSYPPDNHHSSDDVYYWREGRTELPAPLRMRQCPDYIVFTLTRVVVSVFSLSILTCYAFSALTCCLLGDRKGIRSVRISALKRLGMAVRLV